MKIHNYLLILLSYLIIGSSSCSQVSIPRDTNNIQQGILFISDRDKQPAYYLLNPEQREVAKINLGEIHPSQIVERPVWSISMNKLILTVMFDQSTDLYTVNPEGTDLKRLTDTPGIYESSPVPSPNGKWIAYLGSQYDNDIYLMRPDGSEVSNLTKYAGQYTNLVWSPDGSRLYFVSMRAGTPNIFSITTDGANLTNISKGAGLDASFSLSPDGEQIVFDSDRLGQMDLFLVSSDGGLPVSLTNSPNTRDTEPIWSSDGEYIVFKSDIDGGSDLYVFSLANNLITNVTKTPNIQETMFSWTPYNNVIFVAETNGQFEIYQVDTLGSAPINLSNNQANDYNPIWVSFLK